MEKFEDESSTFVAEDDSGDGWPENADTENQKLSLPSTHGLGKCQAFSGRFLVEKELVLHQGQANDALHQLHIDLGHCSYLYRTQVRHADHSQQKKTRAWDNVHFMEDTVRLHAAIYRKCRSAMISLGAGPDLLKTYKELKPEDLTSQTALIDASLPGQRNKSLPWFWTIDIHEDVEANDWMLECKFSSALND